MLAVTSHGRWLNCFWCCDRVEERVEHGRAHSHVARSARGGGVARPFNRGGLAPMGGVGGGLVTVVDPGRGRGSHAGAYCRHATARSARQACGSFTRAVGIGQFRLGSCTGAQGSSPARCCCVGRAGCNMSCSVIVVLHRVGGGGCMCSMRHMGLDSWFRMLARGLHMGLYIPHMVITPAWACALHWS